jgi:hypothetical protein
MPIETPNPCFDITPWNKARNLLVRSDGLFSTVPQCFIELPQSVLNGTPVCIDYHDQFGLGMSGAAHIGFFDKLDPHPVLGTSLGRGRELDSYLMAFYPASFEIFINQHFVVIILQNDNHQAG